ncbi:hypothetical protein [Streptomyces sp. VMFN-G11Ma]|uniref:hypothetical protein n=1 Tax=Streptomyces sp. VMFN-G11Ma TaxID=2135609 RepID=UPI000D351887|nr:hypothetical protein [Streptomyces sp. VMFN-G11Ma]PTM96781.1 hypothetical protein C7821_104164 [Streptomyces sp. VMFN-G11Ma]
MATHTANGDSSLSFWPRVREFAVPPSMIETATARRRVGDWAGACSAAGMDVDLSLRSLTHSHGRALMAQVRADLRQLAPDLLRWHMPRIAPDGLLRPGLTIALARYAAAERDEPGPLHLVVRTPPAWADAGQRISLGLWDGSHPEAYARRHPHPRPGRRFRLDLHRHLWDASRADELRSRSGVDRPVDHERALSERELPDPELPELPETVPHRDRCALNRWAAEAGIVLRAEGRQEAGGSVLVRLGARHRLVLDVPSAGRAPVVRLADSAKSERGHGSSLPVLPDAATWVPPDVELLRAGAIEPGRLHPLVAAALVPDHSPGPAGPAELQEAPRLVDCRGVPHRIGLVDGVLAPLDHDPDEIRREELLVALTGTPLPCLRAIDEAHRRPDCLTGVRERLDHGDIAGALAVVEGLLGPEAVLRDGPLRAELEAAAQRRITYGLFRAGLIGTAHRPPRLRPDDPCRTRDNRAHPRHASHR